MSGTESSQTPSTSAADTPKPSAAPAPRKHPCLLCQQRKVRCDRNEPCSNCIKAGVAKCEAAPQYPPQKRKKRFPEAELLARLRRYERHLRSYGADIDAINREDLNVETQDTFQSSEKLPDSDDLILNPFSVRRSLRHIENNLWEGMNKEFRDAEEILQGSSDDELYQMPITKTYDALESNGDAVFGSSPAQAAAMIHPSPVVIFRLWQTFLDNVNSIIKLIHAPTVQQQLLEATSNLDQVPKNLEALMFGIYSMAIVSMTDDYCRKLFDEERIIVLKRFQAGTRQALQNVEYLRSTDIVVLQAFVLLLLASLQRTDDPRALFCLSGIAVRMGQRIGLATDGTHYGLLPFEVEMRRRLWWQIVHIDTRAAEVSGAGTALLNYTWNTKIPSNFNDSDLFPDMRTVPPERPGLTELSYLRIRCEMAEYFRKSRTARVTDPLPFKDKAIDEFEQRIEKEYLNYCDPSIPIHYMCIIMAKSGFCKLRIGMGHLQIMSNYSPSRTQAEKDKLFELGLTLIENFNLIMATPLTERYIWHMQTNFPFPAHLYTICALRERTTGELVERAWQAMAEGADYRDKHASHKHKDSVLFYAIGNLTVKAWEAHVAALQQPVPTPRFISQLRQKLLLRKKAQNSKQNDSAPLIEKPVDIDMLPPDQFSRQYGWFDPNATMINQSYSQQPIFPSMDSSVSDWNLWNGMMEGIAPVVMNDMDDTAPYFFP